MINSFSLGPITIHFYGIIIMFGAFLALIFVSRDAKRIGEDSEVIWDMFPWLLIAGILGARLWHVFTPPASMVSQGLTSNYYFSHPLEIFAIWKGGLGIPGGVLGGVIALIVYTRKHGINALVWVDLIAPGLALAQAIGRWGNFFNQELYGSPSNLPWAISIDAAHRLPQYSEISHYHPLFLYESLWNLLIMGILIWVGRKFASRLLPGMVFQIYLILYPIGRFLLEYLRLDTSQIGGVNANQAIMAVVALSSGAILILRIIRKNKLEPQVG
ncbi:MAG: prolipoprotein diacylglyceryl transferase [Anaerolineaceae bacterium]|nr:prolipoprotein diacylglyceryl transferase [Anaerolineaceae bacterium]